MYLIEGIFSPLPEVGFIILNLKDAFWEIPLVETSKDKIVLVVQGRFSQIIKAIYSAINGILILYADFPCSKYT